MTSAPLAAHPDRVPRRGPCGARGRTGGGVELPVAADEVADAVADLLVGEVDALGQIPDGHVSVVVGSWPYWAVQTL